MSVCLICDKIIYNYYVVTFSINGENMRNLMLSVSRMLADLSAIGKDIQEILGGWVGPIGLAIGGIGVIYVIILGVQYAKSENDSKRAEAKSRMMNCIIGVIVIAILVSLCLTVDWEGFVQIFGYAGDVYK